MFERQANLPRGKVANSAPVPGAVSRDAGRPLDRQVRTRAEKVFGHNFADVRVHSDREAMESARGFGALAYTAGRHIIGPFDPQQSGGTDAAALLMHELAHVVQQERVRVGEGAAVADAGDLAEREANLLAAGSLAPADLTPDSRPLIRRKPAAGAPASRLVTELRRAVEDEAIAQYRDLGVGTEAENWAKALETARTTSYVMTAKSSAEHAERDVADAWHAIEGGTGYKRARVQSRLGGAFLRMYLDGAVDPSVVAAAGDEIAQSPEFAKLSNDLQRHLEKQQISAANAPERVQQLASAYLNQRLRRGGISFRYELNAVIGGATGVEVPEVTATASDAGLDYVVKVEFLDTYDFENKRGGQYDAYRKRLAALLAAGSYPDFWEAYLREVTGVRRTTGLDDAALFAAFMYAIEKKGWTPGPLPWRVSVPISGHVRLRRRER
jgi:hypothetical protein